MIKRLSQAAASYLLWFAFRKIRNMAVNYMLLLALKTAFQKIAERSKERKRAERRKRQKSTTDKKIKTGKKSRSKSKSNTSKSQ